MFVWASPRFRSGLKSDNLATNAILPPQLGQTEKKRMIPELQTVRFGELALDSGETLRDVEVAYESYGQLNDRK